MAEILDIVNERDEVIGQIDRDDPNKSQYIFRMVFVGFYTQQGDTILQRRSLHKKSGPGLLTSTVSGHVSSGQTYDEAAIRETLEETGVLIDEAKLHRLGVVFGGDAMRAVYAYQYDELMSNLQIEKDEGDGFIKMPVAALRQERIKCPEKFTPFINGDAATVLFDFIDGLR